MIGLWAMRRPFSMTTAQPNTRREILKLTIIDGFAGGGQYRRNGLIVPGSPLIVLDEIAAAETRINATRIKPVKIDAEFIFVERAKGNYEYLDTSLKQSPHSPLIGDRVTLLHRGFEDALPSIIAKIKSRGRADRAIFFLDQFGYTSVSLQSVRLILDQLANPEIIVTFNVDWLIDYLSKEESSSKPLNRLNCLSPRSSIFSI